MLAPVSLQQRTQSAALIIEGKILNQSSFWDSKHQLIYTSNKVQVLKLFKGNAVADVVEIITEGGTIGNERIMHTSTLQLFPGQYGVLFCTPAAASVKKGAYMVYSSLQGFIEYDLFTNTAS